MMGLPLACCTDWMTEEAYRDCIFQWQNQAPGTSWLWRVLFAQEGPIVFFWDGQGWSWYIEGAPDNTLDIGGLALPILTGQWQVLVDCSGCIPVRPMMMPGVNLSRANSLLFSSQLYYRQNAGRTFPYTAVERLDWTAQREDTVVERIAPGLGVALVFADQALFLTGAGLTWWGHTNNRREGDLVTAAVITMQPRAWQGDWDIALWTAVHELGHAFGLEHKGRDGVMSICPAQECDAAYAHRQLAAGFEGWELDQLRRSPFLCVT